MRFGDPVIKDILRRLEASKRPDREIRELRTELMDRAGLRILFTAVETIAAVAEAFKQTKRKDLVKKLYDLLAEPELLLVVRELNTEIAGRERDRVAAGAGRLLGRRHHARAPKVGERKKKKGRSIFDFGVPRRV